jgi:hypothetical protein
MSRPEQELSAKPGARDRQYELRRGTWGNNHTGSTRAIYTRPCPSDMVSAVIIGAVTNRSDAADEARRLCGTLEYALRLRDAQHDTAAAVATNVYKYVIEALGTPG